MTKQKTEIISRQLTRKEIIEDSLKFIPESCGEVIIKDNVGNVMFNSKDIYNYRAFKEGIVNTLKVFLSEEIIENEHKESVTDLQAREILELRRIIRDAKYDLEDYNVAIKTNKNAITNTTKKIIATQTELLVLLKKVDHEGLEPSTTTI